MLLMWVWNLEKADNSSKLSWKQYTLYYLKHEKYIFGRGLLSQIRQIVRLPRLSHSDEEWECVGTEITQVLQEHRNTVTHMPGYNPVPTWENCP